MVTIEGDRGLTACTLVISTLEAELAKARSLREELEVGSLSPAEVMPVRHLCAGLVETAVELAREVAEMAAESQADGTSD